MTRSPGNGWDTDDWRYAPYNDTRTSGRNTAVWVLGGIVVVLLLVLAAGAGYLAASRDAQRTAAPGATPIAAPVATESPVVPSAEAPSFPSAPTPRAAPAAPEPAVTVGDLGLDTPMSRPACDGRGIVVLYSAVTPGAYAQEISSALATYPGASYLRTDMACPSLRPRDENGNVIYAVYRASGYTRQELCADVRAAGPPAYGRWLDTTSDPSVLVTC
ncbi:MAG: serine/threonine protein kinase [Dietzia sp.]